MNKIKDAMLIAKRQKRAREYCKMDEVRVVQILATIVVLLVLSITGILLFIFLHLCNPSCIKCARELEPSYYNGTHCIPKLKHNETCLTSDMCRTDLGLNCETNLCLCDARTQSKWNNISCVYNEYNDTCTWSSECDPNQMTICVASLCTCNTTTSYFDLTLNMCLLKLNESNACTQSIQCRGNMVCPSGSCQCTNMSTHYFDYSTIMCATKRLNNTLCESNRICRNDLGLSCVSSRCQCDTSVRFWDGSSCTLYRLHGQSCSQQSNCNVTQDTLCQSGQCTCDATWKYYDITAQKCLLQRNESVACSLNIQCLGDMVCTSSACQCANTVTHFFDYSSLVCTSKTLNNTLCINTRTCRSDLGLSCVSSRCQCDVSIHYWNGAMCALYRTHGQSCTSTSNCDADQLIICSSGICQCNSTMFLNASTQVCNNKKSLNTSCASAIECQDYNRLFCSLASHRCITCPSGWSMSSRYCYFYSNSQLDWTNANNWCTARGTILVNFLTTDDYYFFKSSVSVNDAYIGLHKPPSTSTWRWTYDNSMFSTSHAWWAGSNPISADDCASLESDYEIQGRYICTTTRDFICQIR